MPSPPYKRGRTVYISPVQPQLVSFYVKSSSGFTNGEHNIVELWDAGDPTTTTDDKQVFKYHHTQTTFGFDQGFKKFESFPPNGQLLTPNEWYNILLVIDWTNKKFDFWVRYTDPSSPIGLQQVYAGIPFISSDVQYFSQFNIYNNAQGTIANVAELRFCNPLGTMFVPVTRQSAVQTSVARFKQTVNGQVDFSYESTLGQYTFSQSSNYRLKGGDSSQVDLLDLRKLYNTFEVWKGTIIVNPAPVTFVLKKISSLFPDQFVNGVNQRDQMSFAIDQYLTTTQVTDIIIDNDPDLKIQRGIPNK